MSGPRCEQVRELIPDLAAGRLDAATAGQVGKHVEGCPSCGDELELVSLLHSGRPEAPPELAWRIRAGLAEAEAGRGGESHTRRNPGRSGSPFPWWGLAAAAVAAVSLGVGIQLRSPTAPEPPAEVPAFVVEREGDGLWLSDDGEIGGAPTLEDLTDEALLRFLEELETGGVA